MIWIGCALWTAAFAGAWWWGWFELRGEHLGYVKSPMPPEVDGDVWIPLRTQSVSVRWHDVQRHVLSGFMPMSSAFDAFNARVESGMARQHAYDDLRNIAVDQFRVQQGTADLSAMFGGPNPFRR
jgi:hypothetical protein